MNVLTPLAIRYLTLLGDSLRNNFYGAPSDSPLSGPELQRASNAIAAVVRDFAAESQQLRLGEMPSPPAEVSLKALLVDPSPELVATFLRANAPVAYTMLEAEALTNLSDCIEQVVSDGIPGDVMECGVFRGGAAIYMKGVLTALEDKERKVWLADSFQGLPEPDRANLMDAVVHAYLRAVGSFAVDFYEVLAAFSLHGLLDERVEFLPGWFHETLPGFTPQLAVLRCDGDWYESTWAILDNLYHQVSPGGFIIIDDYKPLFGAFQAVNEFRAKHGIETPMIPVGGAVHYWRKDLA